MNLKFIKKSFSWLICCVLLLTSVPQAKTFATLEDIEYLGGAYDKLLDAKNRYLDSHPDDHTEYECHHLISRQALNRWGAYIRVRYGEDQYNAFLTADSWQNWAPAITMEKADHELTCSHWDENYTEEQSELSSIYRDFQAKSLIYAGDVIGTLTDEADFIRETFGHKYDRAINEVWQYINSLQFRHINGTTLTMNNPNHDGWYFEYPFA